MKPKYYNLLKRAEHLDPLLWLIVFVVGVSVYLFVWQGGMDKLIQ